MKRAIWVLLALGALAASTPAQEMPAAPWANKFFAGKEPPPVVVHDFGTVPWGTTLTHRFVMTNIYAVPMQIVSDPTVSCGCTRIVRYTQKLEPRETGFIDIEMDGRRFQGAKAVTIQATFAGNRSGQRFQSTAVLQVRAFTRSDVQITPGQAVFGTVAQGKEPTQTLEIQYAGQQINWQIIGVDDTNAPNVKVAVQRVAQARGTTSYRLTATLKPDAAAGVLQDQIVLKTNDPSGPILTVPVSGTVQAPLAIVQGMDVRLDPIPVGQETSRNIMIRGIKPFRITKVEGEGDGLTAKYQPITGPIQVVTITFKPTQPGELKRKLTIHTDQKEMTTVTVEGSAAMTRP